MVTASFSASRNWARISGGAMAHSTDTLLGAEKVMSQPDTSVFGRHFNRSPVTGSHPSSSRRNCSSVTSPDTSSRSASEPIHTPGFSPSPTR